MRHLDSLTVGSSLAACLLVAIWGAPAAAQNKCDASKLSATGRKCDGKVKCVATAASKGAAVVTTCLSKAEGRFASAFAKAESKGGCSTTGDAAAIEAKVDAHVLDLRNEIWDNEPTENDCATAKLRGAGRKCFCKLQCTSTAARRGSAVYPICLQRCEDRFAAAFGRAEGKGACTTTGDAAAIEAKVDAFVADATSEIQVTTTTTSTTITLCPTTTTTSIPLTCGNGVAEFPEECDDGNAMPGDGCTPACQLESANPAVCAGVPTVAGTNLNTLLIASSLEAPVHIAGPRLDPSRVFIVEQPGRIQLVKNGVQLGTPFLAIEGIVQYNQFGEEGLLSVAFDPDYETNRFFYVYYVNNSGNLVIARYEASLCNADDADESSAHIITTISHPGQANHNGGNLNFGPDGFLYAATGDGGGGGDPSDNAQNDASRLGKLLQIDVDTDTVTTWAKGLRNPFRFSFDRANGDLYIGDVGQGSWEEISYDPAPITAGVNYGWDDMEGRHCYEPAVGCPTAGRTLPVLEYCNSAHSEAACSTFQAEKGQAVIGGFVYRGCALPDLQGEYFYSDTYNTWIHTFEGVSSGDAQNVLDRSAQLGSHTVTSFGEDTRGELYFTDYGNGGAGTGEVYKIIPQ